MLGLGLGVGRGGFVPSAFSPSDLANLEAWYKADAGITTVSSAVSVWADQSGNGRDVTQGTAANRPAYGSETLNGIDVLTFDGSDWLNSAGVSSHNFLHQGDSTVFVVARAGNVANPEAGYSYVGSNGGASATVGYYALYDDRPIASANDSLSLTISRGVAGSFAILSVNNNKITPNTWSRVGLATDVDALAADRVDGFVDGVIFNANNTLANAVSASNATYALQIGANGNNILPFLGAMAEIVMYSRKLTTDEITQVDNYLKAKYAL